MTSALPCGWPFWQSSLLLLLATTLSGCGVNNIPTYDEQVKATWAQVQNQYQRRADLVPNLVQTVKAYASHERETLQAVTEARAKVSSLQVDGNLLNDPAKLQQFEAAQGQLTSALSRLMLVVERYPDLKANQNFLTLQSQLEGTENRISVARRDYIQAVERYNREIRTFPGRIWHAVLYRDMPLRETFEATSEDADKAPEVKESLNNSMIPLACRAVHNQGAASQECLDLSRSRNAECESLCKPRRAGLEGHSCCVAALAKGYGHSRRAAPNICSLQDPQRYYGVI
ncbi:LemA family protein [Microbulbifer sp. TRSA002]|uniref:LemA family protein n=1 Tax=Microbulbifer sp. TRSA002 TaxID=3243382 RepID=UPI00403A7916